MLACSLAEKNGVQINTFGFKLPLSVGVISVTAVQHVAVTQALSSVDFLWSSDMRCSSRTQYGLRYEASRVSW